MLSLSMLAGAGADEPQEDPLPDSCDALNDPRLFDELFSAEDEEAESSAGLSSAAALKQEQAAPNGAKPETQEEGGEAVKRQHSSKAEAPPRTPKVKKTSRGSSCSLEKSAEKGDIHFKEAELASKECAGCDATALTLTAMETEAQMTSRTWALKNYWGRLCMWCWKCSRIRYGWMKVPQILQKLEEPAWKHQFKICALSFISLREEGRVQIVATDIDRRSKLLCKFAELLKKRDGAHESVVLIRFHRADGEPDRDVAPCGPDAGRRREAHRSPHAVASSKPACLVAYDSRLQQLSEHRPAERFAIVAGARQVRPSAAERRGRRGRQEEEAQEGMRHRITERKVALCWGNVQPLGTSVHRRLGQETRLKGTWFQWGRPRVAPGPTKSAIGKQCECLSVTHFNL